MKTLAITSVESLDTAVAHAVYLQTRQTAEKAQMDSEKQAIEKAYAARAAKLSEEITVAQGLVYDYCIAHRAELFADKKSRDTLTAVIGFELTPWRVETSSRKLKWKDVIDRLVRLRWGLAYLRTPSQMVDKEALLKDREKLKPDQLTAAGISFEQDEQFFIRPKNESAEATTKEAA